MGFTVNMLKIDSTMTKSRIKISDERKTPARTQHLPGFASTIAAIATPLGEGALGIIRLSGPQAISITQKVFVGASKSSLSTQKSHTLRHGWLAYQGEKIDEVMVAVYRSPRSYTGEDIVEIIGHGGHATMRKALNALLGSGAEHAEPGEFTKRAFLNGKMDLAQAEAVIDLIHAKSDQALQEGLLRLQGGLSRWVKDLRQEILSFYAPLEAAIDFPEEEIESMSLAELQAKLEAIAQKISSLLSSLGNGRVTRGGIKVVLLGRPNVGKSSLFNALLIENRALVSDVPGTTRDTLEETMLHKGFAIDFIDTAGLRSSAGKVETQGIARTMDKVREADVRLYLADLSRPNSAKDKEFINHNLATDNSLLVFTKSDLTNRLSQAQQKILANGLVFLKVSAFTGQGLAELKDKILHLVSRSLKKISPSDMITTSNVRQSQLLRSAHEAAMHVLKSSQEGQSYEVLAMDISRMLQLLGEITGETASEELLHSIFSRFCIGK